MAEVTAVEKSFVEWQDYQAARLQKEIDELKIIVKFLWKILDLDNIKYAKFKELINLEETIGWLTGDSG